MKTRRLASLALVGAAIVAGTTGCTFITPQATVIEYHAADGVGLDAGAFELRDALIVTNAEGSDGNLAGAVINNSDSAQTLTVEFGPDGATNTARLRVGAGQTITLGHDGTPPLLLTGIDTPAGATMDVYFSDGNAPGTLMMVPVLDGTLPRYAPLVPDEATQGE